MKWTTAKDLRQQLQKLWDKGHLLSTLLTDEVYFPKRLAFKKPGSRELSDCFAEVREWINTLHKLRYLRVEMKTVRHPQLGENRIPDSVWLDDLESAVDWLGKQQDLQRFLQLLDSTRQRQPVLLSWLQKYPIKALALAVSWEKLLDVIDWMRANPHPGIYLREVDIAGIDSKFIESHRGVLMDWLDRLLPAEWINHEAHGVSQFARRYGFRQKPLRLRFRILDSGLRLLPGQDQDITLTQSDFKQLEQHPLFQGKIRRVFITENEINFLSFPDCENSIVIFGSGYGFEVFTNITWLAACQIYYWGDIDTNGFAILDQLREKLPDAQSMLMDTKTLLNHRHAWGVEDKARILQLKRLTSNEYRLYLALCENLFAANLRLEQEKIGFGYLQQALSRL